MLSHLELVYMNARYYAPYINRHISPDSIIPQPSNPQSLNRYSYVLNNPVNFTDPTGHYATHDARGGSIDDCKANLNCYIYPEGHGKAGWEIGTTYAEIAQAEQNLVEGAITGGTILLSLVGADTIADVGEASYCLATGQYGCAAMSGVATLAPGLPARVFNNIPGVNRLSGWIDNAARRLLGACSFSGETLVMTEDGLVPISEVELWDKVLAYNEETGEIGYYPIIAVWEHLDSIIVTLTIDGEEIETTPEHPFYTATGDWLAAADLQIGDKIRTAEWETGTVEAIHFTTAPQPMYNFTVATAHTYFVGDGQWLVHNYCPLRLDSPRTFSRGGDNFLLEMGDSKYGWTHIWERHIRQGADDALFANRSKFLNSASQEDIFNLLEQTLQNGTPGSYYDMTTYTHTIDGVSYRATVYGDGRIQTFHPLEP